MKKILALLLAAVMCLSFAACGEETNNNESHSGEDTINNFQQEMQNNETTSANSNESTDSTDYANEFAEILCSGKWVMREGDANLSFAKDGTFVWTSDSENVNCTWSFVRYFDSFSEFPLAMGNSEFSDDYCVFWGYGRDNNDIVIGYNNDGMLIMHHKDQYWTKAE